MSLVRAVARPMLASMFVVGGVNALQEAPALAARAKPVADRLGTMANRAFPQLPVPKDATGWVRLNGAIHVVGGLMLATGHLPRLTSWTLAATLVPTTVAGHAFWRETDPATRKTQRTMFFKNVSMMGGLLMTGIDPDPHKKMLVVRAKDKVKELVPTS